jgi:DNA-binding CsgD family transcriptional regulator
MLVARETETAILGRFLDGQPSWPAALLVEGETGIGKTALLMNTQTLADQLKYIVLSAFPDEANTASQLATLADLIAGIPADEVASLPPPLRRAVRAAAWQAHPQRSCPDVRTTATAVFSLLRNLARKQPVLLMIDDLQWLDSASARALSIILTRLRVEPVGLLAGVRADWSGNLPPLATDRLPASRVDHLRLGPLSPAALRALVQRQLGRSLSRPQLRWLHSVSRGNPLLARELAAQAEARELPAFYGVPLIPALLRQGMLAGAAKLGPGALDVLLVAALTADPTLAVVCAAARKPATAYCDLEAGVRAGVLTIVNGTISFAHPLIRQAVTEQARPDRRRAIHRRLAAIVPGLEDRVHHQALAARGPDGELAGQAEMAAALAVCHRAHDAAGELAGLALALTPLTQPQERLRRAIMVAERQCAAADPERACQSLEDIAPGVRPGPGRAELWRRLAWYRAYSGTAAGTRRTLLDRALAEAGDHTGLRLTIQADQLLWQSWAGQPTGQSRPLLALAARTADPGLRARCRASLAFADFVLGRGLRLDLLDPALATARPFTGAELRPGAVAGYLLHWAGDFDRARSLLEREQKSAREQGAEISLPLLSWALAETEIWTGNWRKAEQVVAIGGRQADDCGSPLAVGFMTAARGLLRACRGEAEAGLADAGRAVELARDLGMPVLAAVAAQAIGIATLPAGDALGAHDQLGPLVASLPGATLAEPALCRFVLDDVEALIRLGDFVQAGRLLDTFRLRSARLGRSWASAAAFRCQGLLLAAQGESAGAEHALEAALAIHQRLPMPFELARTLLAAGEIHRRARHKRRAAQALQRALTIFEELGAPLWAERVRDEHSRVGIRSAALSTGYVLTAAERRVAGLVAAGHTNAEIAATLFMGRRTVEAHLSRVYRKLGVRSRTELCRNLGAARG